MAAPDGPTGDIVYLTQGPEGALYYIDLGVSDTTGQVGVSKIHRISFIGCQPASRGAGLGEPDIGTDAAGGQLLQRGLLRSRRPTTDLCVELRRQHHVDSGQPNAYVHHAGPLSGPAHRIRRSEFHDLGAAEHQRRTIGRR